jgi:deoxyribonuclease IV
MLCARVEELGPYLDALGRHPRVGVCLDICHAFAAGHDLTAPGGGDEVFATLAEAAGPERLKLVHANDSAAPCASRADRHAGMGAGQIGAEPFSKIIFHPAMAGVPMIVETPGKHGKDIALLKGLRDGSGARRARRRRGALC